MTPDEPEELPAEAVRRKGDRADRAAGPADAEELVRHGLVIGSKHRAEAGSDDVELAVTEGQRLGIRLDPLELHAAGGWPRAGPTRSSRG